MVVGTWEADDPAYSRPIAAPLERCAELLGVDLATIQRAAADVEPYIRVDGSKVWSLMQLERRLCPEAYGRVRGGYVSRRRRPAHDQPFPQVGERGSERLEGEAIDLAASGDMAGRSANPRKGTPGRLALLVLVDGCVAEG
jgi:hypothetical protein